MRISKNQLKAKLSGALIKRRDEKRNEFLVVYEVVETSFAHVHDLAIKSRNKSCWKLIVKTIDKNGFKQAAIHVTSAGQFLREFEFINDDSK